MSEREAQLAFFFPALSLPRLSHGGGRRRKGRGVLNPGRTCLNVLLPVAAEFFKGLIFSHLLGFKRICAYLDRKEKRSHSLLFPTMAISPLCRRLQQKQGFEGPIGWRTRVIPLFSRGKKVNKRGERKAFPFFSFFLFLGGEEKGRLDGITKGGRRGPPSPFL